MLSTSEIMELEKRLLKYRAKKYGKYFFFIILFFTISLCFYFFYPTALSWFQKNTSDTNTTTLVQSNMNTVKTKENNQTLLPDKAKKQEETPSPQESSIKTTNVPILENQHVVSQDHQIKNISDTTSRKNDFLVLNMPDIKPDGKFLTPKEETVILNDDDAYSKKNDSSLLSQTAVVAPSPYLQVAPNETPKLEQQKEEEPVKNKVFIETQEIDSLHYLKDKFEKTHNIVFSLMLAEEYYMIKNYEESLKWALLSNDIDSSNERSWIWFAKAKNKLGQKEDAIKALKAYLQSHQSKEVKGLLNQLNSGNSYD